MKQSMLSYQGFHGHCADIYTAVERKISEISERKNQE